MLGEMHLIAFSCDAQTGLGEDASGCARIWFLVEYRYHQVGPKEMHQTAPVAELRRESQEETRPSQEGSEGSQESGGSHDSITYFSIFPWGGGCLLSRCMKGSSWSTVDEIR